ncbi:hypothetical protein Pmani_025780 [Petrolisthes manimaculis]|uniref:Exonuclease domain-containing protein n=1 Tax=Petrolisthes manimaculis TaxID=1843537 RepID=A0AAE1TY25_9EUCA|nr:hypothetical protein Pmani_025780 [Petrolisthes manimaculis]
MSRNPSKHLAYHESAKRTFQEKYEYIKHIHNELTNTLAENKFNPDSPAQQELLKQLKEKEERYRTEMYLLENDNPDMIKDTFHGARIIPHTESWKTKQRVLNKHRVRSKNKEKKTLQEGKTLLTTEDLAALKKKKKEIDKLKMAWPKMFLTEIGKLSDLSLDTSERYALEMADMQEFLKAALKPSRSGEIARWIRIIRPTKISHVVTVLVEGVSLADILEASQLSPDQHTDTSASSQVTDSLENGNADVTMEEVCDSTDIMNNTQSDNKRTQGENHGRQLKWLSDVLPRTSRSTNIKVEVMAPAKYKVAPIEELIKISLNRKHKEKLLQDSRLCENFKKEDTDVEFRDVFPLTIKKESYNLPESDNFDRRKLLLSIDELAGNCYPLNYPGLPGYGDPAFKNTCDSYSEVTPSSPMFSLDCEFIHAVNNEVMVFWISVVDETLEVVYESFINPGIPQSDYLDLYKHHWFKLKDVTTKLCDVQNDLKKILPTDAILVGHSLNHDLMHLKMMHPYVIDTASIYSLRKLASTLKHLIYKFLGETIQKDNEAHNPTEDATAVMKLVQLKLKHDFKFGNCAVDKLATRYCWQTGTYDITPHAAERRKVWDTITKKNYAITLFQHLSSLRIALLTTPLGMEHYECVRPGMKNVYIEVLPGNKHVSKKAAEVVRNRNWTFVHMKMDQKLEESQSSEGLRHHLRKLDKRLGRIINGAASKSLLVFLFSGSSLNAPEDKLSNGFAMIGVKDLPCHFRINN